MKPSRQIAPTAADFDPLLVLFNSRRYAELERQVQGLLTQYPNAPFAWQLLGGALQMQGKDALPAFQKVAELSPNDAGAHFNLGVAFKSAGQLEQAAACYRRALALKPGYVEALGNLGNVLQDLRQLEEAVRCYRQALGVQPQAVGTLNNLGTALRDMGQIDEAVGCYQQALRLKPDFADAHFNLGNAQRDLHLLEQAAQSYRQAVRLKPEFAAAHCNLGSVLKELEQVDAALFHLQQAVTLQPVFAEAQRNLGTALQMLGRIEAALPHLQKAAALKPNSLSYAMLPHLLLPPIPHSVDDILYWRERYRRGLENLLNNPVWRNQPATAEELSGGSFYLAYHNSDNRPLMEALNQLYRTCVPQLTFTAPHIPNWQTPSDRKQRIKVGFLSDFFYEHTIGKHYKGFIAHLDRNVFEVVVIHGTKSRQDSFRHALDALSDKSILLPNSLKDQQQMVAAERLDILFYTDIGMSSGSYLLAYSRLAPVQATSWGHPDTTGLDTMDYYVAATTNEATGAQVHYTERLVRLNRLPCFYYQTPASDVPPLTKSELGLPESGTLYGCPQNLFKVHPDFDAILAEIATGDPNGHIVFPQGKYAEWTALLKARWSKNFPILTERVLFMPRMNWKQFMATLSHMDVLLDPLYFGSGNTFYDAMMHGTPVITCPGKFGRGRNVAAAYQQMAIANVPVVQELKDYAPLALALGKDPAYRQVLKKDSLAAAHLLFEDSQAVREFASFLIDSVAPANIHNRLAEDWVPHP